MEKIFNTQNLNILTKQFSSIVITTCGPCIIGSSSDVEYIIKRSIELFNIKIEKKESVNFFDSFGYKIDIK